MEWKNIICIVCEMVEWKIGNALIKLKNFYAHSCRLVFNEDKMQQSKSLLHTYGIYIIYGIYIHTYMLKCSFVSL